MSLLGRGGYFSPEAPVIAAIGPAEAVIGQKVVLDGTGSTGEIDSYAWEQTAGPTVTIADTKNPRATFTPIQLGTYTFALTIKGPGGTAGPMTVTTTVTEAATPPKADAGPDQTVIRGRAVRLDASATKAADAVTWSQVSGPQVALTGAMTTNPTFTYQLMPLPTAPGPNSGYLAENAPLVFRVTANGPGGTATDDVVIYPRPESCSGLSVRYRTRGEWRISGTSDLIAGQRVTAVLGSDLTGKVIGTATVDAAGAFSIRTATPNPGVIRTISLVSNTGGRQLAVPVTVTN